MLVCVLTCVFSLRARLRVHSRQRHIDDGSAVPRRQVRLLSLHRSDVTANISGVLNTVFGLGRWCGGDGVSGALGVLGDMDVLSSKSVADVRQAAADTAAKYLWNVMVCVVHCNYSSDVVGAANAYRSDVSLVRDRLGSWTFVWTAVCACGCVGVHVHFVWLHRVPPGLVSCGLHVRKSEVVGALTYRVDRIYVPADCERSRGSAGTAGSAVIGSWLFVVRGAK